MAVQTQVDQLIRQYAAVDAVAADIISDKHQMVDLDAKRNKNREALRQLWSNTKDESTSSQSWVCFGNTFIKMKTDRCVQILEKDQATLTTEIDELQTNLKSKVDELNKMEGKAELRGFKLKGMTMEEVFGSGK